MKQLKNRKGFTLIELIIVITILGILAVIAVPRLTGFTAQAQVSACQANQRTIESAYEACLAHEPTKASVDITVKYLVDNKYLTADPKCPATNTDTYTLTDGVCTCSTAGHSR